VYFSEIVRRIKLIEALSPAAYCSKREPVMALPLRSRRPEVIILRDLTGTEAAWDADTPTSEPMSLSKEAVALEVEKPGSIKPICLDALGLKYRG
jgi:hypothetical protein